MTKASQKMSINSSHKISPLEPLGGLQRIRLNPIDTLFCVFLVLIWSELCYRSILEFYGFTPTESIICDCLRLVLSTATNIGLNIVKNVELGYDVSIFHKVTVPSNDCESFALTALLSLCFFSLRRFIGQGVIFLITPAFDYYMGLSMKLLEAVVDEIMYPAHFVAGLHRHRLKVTSLPPTPPPSPIKSLTSREACPTFLSTPSSFSGAYPSLPRNKVIQHHKPSPNSARPGRLSPSATPSRSHRLDESPLNREEMRLYIAVAGIESARTIQSQPKYRGFFRMNIPLYLAEREPQVVIPASDIKRTSGQDSLKDHSEAIILGSTIDMTASVPDVVPYSTLSKEVEALPMDISPLPPLVNSMVEDAPNSSPVTQLVSNSPVTPNEESEFRPAPTPAPAFAPTPVPTSEALDKGKGRVRPSNLPTLESQIKGGTTYGTASAPKIPSRLSTSTLPAEPSRPDAEIPVVAPRAPTPLAPSSQPTPPAPAPSPPSPAPPALNKGKGRASTSNLWIPRPRRPAPNSTAPAPKVPSPLSTSTLPADSDPPEAESPVVAPPRAPTPQAPSPPSTPPVSVPSSSSPTPPALDKDEGRAIPPSPFIPKPQTKGSPSPSITSLPEIPSQLPNPTPLEDAGSPMAETPVGAPTPIPNPETTPTESTLPAAVCLASPIVQEPQVPESMVDSDGDSIMEDDFSDSSREGQVDPVQPIETTVGMEGVQVPAGPETVAIPTPFKKPAPVSTDPSSVPPVAERGVSLQELLLQKEPALTMQEGPVPFFPVEYAAETEMVIMDEGPAPQQATTQPTISLFATLANTPFVLPNAQSDFPQTQPAVDTFMMETDTDTVTANLPKPIDVDTQPPSGSSTFTQVSVRSSERSQPMSPFRSVAIGASLTCSDEKEAQAKSLASAPAPLVGPRYSEMGRVRRFSPPSRPLPKKWTSSSLGYVPRRPLDEDDIILPKETGGDSEFEDDD